MRTGSSLLALLAAITLCPPASADVKHVVGKGHTIEAIANRYHVSTKSIVLANHLKDVKRLQIGDVLMIPKADPKKAHGADDRAADKKDAKARSGKDGKPERPSSYAARPKTPGVIHVKRMGSTEEADLKVDRSGKVAPTTLKSLAKLMRSPAGVTHPIEPRLVSLLGVVSNHFGSRKIEIVSGFRPFAPAQYTAHSNHNHGKAVDFRVVGVPNEAVRDFCRTLKNVGCGYYPNSSFVHMDVRESSAFWVDYSKPGEPPRYTTASSDPDEGTSDGHAGSRPTANTAPDAPTEPSAPGAPESAAAED